MRHKLSQKAYNKQHKTESRRSKGFF